MKEAISNDAILIRHKAGFKIQPRESDRIKTTKHQISNITPAALLNLPLSVYFYNASHKFLKSNLYNTIACGFYSESQVEGEELARIFPRSISNLLIHNNQEVLTTEQCKIYEEYVIHKDDSIFNSLSIKLPFYNVRGKLAGIVGLSIIYELNQFKPALEQLIQLDLLNAQYYKKHHLTINNIYLSKRETSIVEYLIKGKTAKEIAAIFQLSRRTIEHCIENMKSKFKAKTKYELIDLLRSNQQYSNQ